MSYTKILVHCVWASKNRVPMINTAIIPAFITHIKENAQQKDIYIDTINMVENHVHCLISLGSTQNIAKVMELIKGESSFWYNKQDFGNKLYWQDDYFAVSIGESQVDVVRKYILNQQKHHQKKTFQQEYEEFIAAYKFEE